MFFFPNSDHVVLLQRIVSFKFMYVFKYVRVIYIKTKGQIPPENIGIFVELYYGSVLGTNFASVSCATL